MNCICVDDNPLALEALKQHIEQIEFLNLVGSFTDTLKARKTITSDQIDLIFLDVEMPGISGIELIESLENPPLIIMVTAKKEYAIEAFEKHVVDYLVKPVSLPRFVSAVNFAEKIYKSRLINLASKDILFVKADGKWNKIQVSDIKYLQAMGDYVRIFERDSNYMVNKTMKSFIERLPADKFARVHRSYIINITKIENIEDNSIVIDKDVIPISEGFKTEFMKKLNLLK